MPEYAPARPARSEPQTKRGTAANRGAASQLGHPLHEATVRTSTNLRAASARIASDFSQVRIYSREEFRGATGASKQAPIYLAVSSPADPHERAADRSADEVAAQIHTGASARARASRASSGRPSRQPTVEMPASVVKVLAATGRPLGDGVRHDMERRFGHDFSCVRIHTDALAENSAREMKARAFTVGQDVVFRAGRYAPGTREGQRLIAHELAHTMERTSSATVWLDRQDEGHAGHAVLDTPAIPYVAGITVDEVALRSSPAGRRTDNRFHNLVASLRQDVRLVVEARTGGWMKVRVIAGTALDGKTNRPMNAAGLTGYVSAELLASRKEAVPSATPWPPIDPAAYSSLETFSAGWPDRVSSTEAIEQCGSASPGRCGRTRRLPLQGSALRNGSRVRDSERASRSSRRCTATTRRCTSRITD